MQVFEIFHEEMMDKARWCKFYAFKYITDMLAEHNSIDLTNQCVEFDNGCEETYIDKVYVDNNGKIMLKDSDGIPYEFDSNMFSQMEMYKLAEAVQIKLTFG